MRIFPVYQAINIRQNQNNITKPFFKGKKNPVYVIDSYGNYMRLDSQNIAARVFGALKNSISQVVAGSRKKTAGLIFVPASKIEKYEGDTADFDTIQEIIKNAEKDNKKESIYAFRYDGSYKKYKSRNEVSEVLGVKSSKIKYTEKNVKDLNGYIFIPAKNVEEKDEDGNISLNKSKVESILNEAFTKRKKPIYVISEDGNYKTFANQQEAGEYLGVSYQSINYAIGGDLKTVSGKVVAGAGKVETRLEGGKVIVDSDKIEKLLTERIPKRKAAIYALKINGEYQRFASTVEASETLGISEKSIGEVLRKGAKTTGKYIFVYANEVEQKDKDGDIILDKNKMEKIIEKSLRIGNKPVYTIDSSGNYTKYPSVFIAADELGICAQTIKRVVNTPNATKGFSFAYSDMIEREDVDGNRIIDTAIIEIMQKWANSKFFYAVNEKGEYKKCYNKNQAAEELGIPVQKIRYQLEHNILKPVNGYIFISANKMETSSNRNGEVTVNLSTIKKLLENFKSTEEE